MYVGTVTVIILYGLNNLLAKNSHRWCQKVKYVQNWSCVKQ